MQADGEQLAALRRREAQIMAELAATVRRRRSLAAPARSVPRPRARPASASTATSEVLPFTVVSRNAGWPHQADVEPNREYEKGWEARKAYDGRDSARLTSASRENLSDAHARVDRRRRAIRRPESAVQLRRRENRTRQRPGSAAARTTARPITMIGGMHIGGSASIPPDRSGADGGSRPGSHVVLAAEQRASGARRSSDASGTDQARGRGMEAWGGPGATSGNALVRRHYSPPNRVEVANTNEAKRSRPASAPQSSPLANSSKRGGSATRATGKTRLDVGGCSRFKRPTTAPATTSATGNDDKRMPVLSMPRVPDSAEPLGVVDMTARGGAAALRKFVRLARMSQPDEVMSDGDSDNTTDETVIRRINPEEQAARSTALSKGMSAAVVGEAGVPAAGDSKGDASARSRSTLSHDARWLGARRDAVQVIERTESNRELLVYRPFRRPRQVLWRGVTWARSSSMIVSVAGIELAGRIHNTGTRADERKVEVEVYEPGTCRVASIVVAMVDYEKLFSSKPEDRKLLQAGHRMAFCRRLVAMLSFGPWGKKGRRRKRGSIQRAQAAAQEQLQESRSNGTGEPTTTVRRTRRARRRPMSALPRTSQEYAKSSGSLVSRDVDAVEVRRPQSAHPSRSAPEAQRERSASTSCGISAWDSGADSQEEQAQAPFFAAHPDTGDWGSMVPIESDKSSSSADERQTAQTTTPAVMPKYRKMRRKTRRLGGATFFSIDNGVLRLSNMPQRQWFLERMQEEKMKEKRSEARRHKVLSAEERRLRKIQRRKRKARALATRAKELRAKLNGDFFDPKLFFSADEFQFALLRRTQAKVAAGEAGWRNRPRTLPLGHPDQPMNADWQFLMRVGRRLGGRLMVVSAFENRHQRRSVQLDAYDCSSNKRAFLPLNLRIARDIVAVGARMLAKLRKAGELKRSHTQPLLSVGRVPVAVSDGNVLTSTTGQEHSCLNSASVETAEWAASEVLSFPEDPIEWGYHERRVVVVGVINLLQATHTHSATKLKLLRRVGLDYERTDTEALQRHLLRQNRANFGAACTVGSESNHEEVAATVATRMLTEAVRAGGEKRTGENDSQAEKSSTKTAKVGSRRRKEKVRRSIFTGEVEGPKAMGAHPLDGELACEMERQRKMRIAIGSGAELDNGNNESDSVSPSLHGTPLAEAYTLSVGELVTAAGCDLNGQFVSPVARHLPSLQRQRDAVEGSLPLLFRPPPPHLRTMLLKHSHERHPLRAGGSQARCRRLDADWAAWRRRWKTAVTPARRMRDGTLIAAGTMRLPGGSRSRATKDGNSCRGTLVQFEAWEVANILHGVSAAQRLEQPPEEYQGEAAAMVAELPRIAPDGDDTVHGERSVVGRTNCPAFQPPDAPVAECVSRRQLDPADLAAAENRDWDGLRRVKMSRDAERRRKAERETADKNDKRRRRRRSRRRRQAKKKARDDSDDSSSSDEDYGMRRFGSKRAGTQRATLALARAKAIAARFKARARRLLPQKHIPYDNPEVTLGRGSSSSDDSEPRRRRESHAESFDLSISPRTERQSARLSLISSASEALAPSEADVNRVVMRAAVSNPFEGGGLSDAIVIVVGDPATGATQTLAAQRSDIVNLLARPSPRFQAAARQRVRDSGQGGVGNDKFVDLCDGSLTPEDEIQREAWNCGTRQLSAALVRRMIRERLLWAPHSSGSVLSRDTLPRGVAVARVVTGSARYALMLDRCVARRALFVPEVAMAEAHPLVSARSTGSTAGTSSSETSDEDDLPHHAAIAAQETSLPSQIGRYFIIQVHCSYPDVWFVAWDVRHRCETRLRLPRIEAEALLNAMSQPPMRTVTSGDTDGIPAAQTRRDSSTSGSSGDARSSTPREPPLLTDGGIDLWPKEREHLIDMHIEALILVRSNPWEAPRLVYLPAGSASVLDGLDDSSDSESSASSGGNLALERAGLRRRSSS